MPNGDKEPKKEAKKVSKVPSGYKFKAPGEGGREYYEKPSETIDPAKKYPGEKYPPGKEPIPADPKKYQGWLIDKIKSGVHPDTLVSKGYATPGGIEPLRKFYSTDVVYTEPEPKQKEPLSLKHGLNVARQISPEASTKDYQAYLYPDPNKGYAGATTKFFVGEKEIETPSASSYSTGAFKPTYKTGSSSLNTGTNLGTVKPDVVTESEAPLGTGINAYKNITPIRIQGGQDVRNVGKQTEFTPERYQRKAKGGLISKLRGYADGGDIPETDASGKPMTNNSGQSTTGKDTTSGLSNLMQGLGGGGASSPISLATNLYGNYVNPMLERATQDQYGRINTGSKTGDYAAGIASGALKGATKGAELGSALGPLGMAAGAAVGDVAGMISGGLKAQRDRQAIADEKKQQEIAILAAQQRQRNDRQDYARNQQLQERGFKKGGLVDKMSGSNEMDMMINKNNRNHLMRRIGEIGHEAAMKEYNDYFAEESKPKRFSIKK